MVNHRRTNRQSGSTLTEVLIAGIVVTAVALSFATAQPAGEGQVRTAFESTVAMRVLQSDLERARATRATLTPGTTSIPVSEAANAELLDACAERIVTVAEPGLCDVRTRISWLPRGSTARTSRELATRIAVSGAPR